MQSKAVPLVHDRYPVIRNGAGNDDRVRRRGIGNGHISRGQPGTQARVELVT